MLLGELAAPLQLPRLLRRAPRLARLPRGSGQPVVDLPGWRTGEPTMAPLRGYLRWLGYDARPWGLGTNQGDVPALTRALVPTVRDLAEDAGQPVHLVGWSLGGTIAREVARVLGPDAVAQVITLGSPLEGGPLHTITGASFGAADRERIAARIARAERRRLEVPLTSVYTRRDAVVSWPASLDRRTPAATHHEVGSTHCSLGVDPDVWEIVARRLADPPPGAVASRGRSRTGASA